MDIIKEIQKIDTVLMSKTIEDITQSLREIENNVMRNIYLGDE